MQAAQMVDDNLEVEWHVSMTPGYIQKGEQAVFGGRTLTPSEVRKWNASCVRAAELEAEEAICRRFRFARIDALREMAAGGCIESARELREELADYRLQLVEDLRMDPGEVEKFRESYRALGSGLRESIYRRDGRKCGICCTTEGRFEIDHKMPFSRGGRHTHENLWVLCRECNQLKGTMTVEEFMEALAENPEWLH
jgi:hypothetical protein